MKKFNKIVALLVVGFALSGVQAWAEGKKAGESSVPCEGNAGKKESGKADSVVADEKPASEAGSADAGKKPEKK